MEQHAGTGGRPVDPAQASRNAQPDGPAEVVDEHGHGNTPAAWAAVGICLVGSLIASLAVVFTSLTWGIIGGVLAAVVAPVVGKVLSAKGYGVESESGRPAGVGRAGTP